MKIKTKITIVIVDDEKIVRNSLIRLINNYFKDKQVNLNMIECNDGIELLVTVYISFLKNIHVDLIISDENMRVISGGFSSKIWYSLLAQNIIREIPMYIITAIGSNTNKDNYSKIVKKIISKPIDSKNVSNLLSDFIK